MPITYLALLRGINVGGNNIIKMADLRACFEEMGFSDVKTYIQSGNVIFKAEEKDSDALTKLISAALAKAFNYHGKVFVITSDHLKNVVKEATKGFGSEPETYRYDVIFCGSPLLPKAALKEIRLREGVDTAHPGTHALYFSRLIARAGQSYLSTIVKLPLYQNVTIRNWNTTTKLWGMVEEISL